MKLIPYLNFDGNTEAALNFYQKVFNGEISDLSRFGDHGPAGYQDKIMHARLAFGENMLMFSDSRPDKPVTLGDGINLSIGLNDEVQARSIFEQLSEGGTVSMTMEKQFWGALFGMVTDQFGIHWMINCELPA